MFRSRAPRRAPAGFTLVELVVVVAILAVLTGLVLPAVQKVRAAAHRAACLNNLHQTGVAFQTHHSEKGRFPPGGVELRFGNTPTRRQLAWGAYLLPYLGEAPLYARLRLDTPFDSPENAGPAAAVLPVFLCPATNRTSKRVEGRGATDYGGIYGERLLSPNNPAKGAMLYDRQLRADDIPDGLASTALVAEDSGWADGQWINGRNLFDQAYPINAAPPTENDMRSEHRGGANVLFADAAARFVRQTIPNAALAAICTRAGNDAVSPDDL